MTYAIANHHGTHFNREQTQWSVFDQDRQYCGHVFLAAAWAVPASIHARFNIPSHIDLYLTSQGEWAQTFEIAQYLIATQSALEFVVKGALLALFVPSEWAIDNGNPNTYSDYHIFRDRAGYWNAVEIESPVVVSNLPNYA